MDVRKKYFAKVQVDFSNMRLIKSTSKDDALAVKMKTKDGRSFELFFKKIDFFLLFVDKLQFRISHAISRTYVVHMQLGFFELIIEVNEN